jgi:hypothetical protein
MGLKIPATRPGATCADSRTSNGRTLIGVSMEARSRASKTAEILAYMIVKLLLRLEGFHATGDRMLTIRGSFIFQTRLTD